jgi:hypothetical protein
LPAKQCPRSALSGMEVRNDTRAISERSWQVCHTLIHHRFSKETFIEKQDLRYTDTFNHLREGGTISLNGKDYVWNGIFFVTPLNGKTILWQYVSWKDMLKVIKNENCEIILDCKYLFT